MCTYFANKADSDSDSEQLHSTLGLMLRWVTSKQTLATLLEVREQASYRMTFYEVIT